MSAPPLERVRVPGEEHARRRAWAVAQAALAARRAAAPPDAAAGRRSAALAPVLTAVAVAVVAGLGLSAPGRATAAWLGARISDVGGRPAPVRHAPPPAPYARVPGGGRLLAVADQGLFAFGLGPAPRQLLGRVDAATWSPHGRFAAAVRGIELIAVDVHGRRRWSLAAERAIRWPAWSPSGFRVAYVTGTAGAGGRTIHVVAGDGTGDHVLAASGPAPPVWQPGAAPAERLATVDAAGRVVLRDADSGRVLWRTRLAHAPLQLAWAAGGRRLLALEHRRVVFLDGTSGRPVGGSATQMRTTNVALAPRPGHHGYALVQRTLARGPAPRARLTVVWTDAEDRRVVDASSVLFASGAIRGIAWSPRGDWLAADLHGVEGWDLMRLRGRGIDRARTLAAGRGARLAGWCCA